MEQKRRYTGVNLLSFIAAIAGVVVSFSLLKEDVISTARTLYEYFPMEFGVIPASTMQGAYYLGIFITVTQIVSASVAFRKGLPVGTRILSAILLIVSVPFDAWTDIVFRSGLFTGDVMVATVTTIAFYTFGSEIMQSLSWIVIFVTWRLAIREAMVFVAQTQAGIKSIVPEWKRLHSSAQTTEMRSYNVPQSIPRTSQPQRGNPQQTTRPAPRPQPVSSRNEPTYHPISHSTNVSPEVEAELDELESSFRQSMGIN